MFADMFEQTKDKKVVNRRRMLGAGGGAALAAAIMGLSPDSAKAQTSELTVDIAVDVSTFERRNPAEEGADPTGPFYVWGAIYPGGTMDANGEVSDDAESIGDFHCWGWTYDPKPPGFEDPSGQVVNQMWRFPGMGDIMLQGMDVGVKAIVGGTGLFNGARGEIEYTGIAWPESGPRIRSTLKFT